MIFRCVSIRFAVVVLFGLAVPPVSGSPQGAAENLVPNGDFSGGVSGVLPAGWVTGAPRPELMPGFRVAREGGKPSLHIRGAGTTDCVGWISTPVRLSAGKTYLFRVRFRKSETVNPLQHLAFMVSTPAASLGIAEYRRLDGNRAEGAGRVCFSGDGFVDAKVRIQYRLCGDGEAWIEEVSLTETDPVPPRWVRVACTRGPATLEEYGLPVFRGALDVAGRGKADLVLLPEYMNGEIVTEPLDGPSAALMSSKAREYGMYVAGTIAREDKAAGRLYNTALLFGRDGKPVGSYDKIHLYGPELKREGVTPGSRVPVFQADFGRVGFMTCCDVSFTDVVELLALKGADMVLFPNLGYDRGLMRVRALDNLVNIVASSRSGSYGVWDAAGRDALSSTTLAAGSPAFRDVVETMSGTLGILIVSVDLNAVLPPETAAGVRFPVARSRRQFGNQRVWLEEEILREKQRWWAE